MIWWFLGGLLLVTALIVLCVWLIRKAIEASD